MKRKRAFCGVEWDGEAKSLDISHSGQTSRNPVTSLRHFIPTAQVRYRMKQCAVENRLRRSKRYLPDRIV